MSMASSDKRRARARFLTLRMGAVAALVSATLLAAAAPAVASPSMQVTGSSFASLAITQWVGSSATLFGLNINWQVSSSVVGLNNFGQNQIDFAASDIPYSAEQSANYPTQPYQYLPDVAGGLAFMFNLTGQDGQQITNLNLDANIVGKMFLGMIRKWNDPLIALANPNIAANLPNIDIHPVYRADASGENYLLTDYLLHQDQGDIVPAQTAFQTVPGQPSATWPIPCGSCNVSGSTYPAWSGQTTLVPQNGSDGAANYVSALSSQGAITYVETAFAKEHGFPVANLKNQYGAYVQPTSFNVATALEAAQLHADLTQDLSGVYTNVQQNAYPLSAYSYLVTPCSPSLAAAQQTSCAANPVGPPESHPTGATSPFPSQKGQALGQFAAFLACAGQARMDVLGYSPLPPVLVQEDFAAIGRMNGGVQPPAPTAANCKNPYVDGEIPLPGSPVVAGVVGGGVSNAAPAAGGSTTSTGAAAAGPAATGAGAAGKGGAAGSGASGGTAGHGSGSGSSGSSGSSKSEAAIAAAAGLTPQLAAEGYTVVNGQLVRKLDPAQQYSRANQLVSATDAVASPTAGMYIGWALLVLGVIFLPPLIALRVTRRTPATVDASALGTGPDA